MNPPIVAELTTPSAHSSNNATALVHTITAPPPPSDGRSRRGCLGEPHAHRGIRSSFRALDSSNDAAAWSQDELASLSVNDTHARRHRRRSGVRRAHRVLGL